MNLPFISVALKQLFSKPSTERYPFVNKEAPPHYRGKIVFHEDRCINCGMCIRVCSPGAIERTVEKQEDGDQVTFRFNMGSCTFCQMCSDFCTKHSIEMSQEYSMIALHGEETIVTGSFFKAKPAPKAPPTDAAKPAAKAAEPAPPAVEKAAEPTPPVAEKAAEPAPPVAEAAAPCDSQPEAAQPEPASEQPQPEAKAVPLSAEPAAEAAAKPAKAKKPTAAKPKKAKKPAEPGQE